ncbi:HAMP domain-containing sensor histidine kinase [Streptomyces sp. RFCAC02]|uniref:sensor histidine kinase n=1 Tax=Streptomyces sp. RFCAC02 TaxID=2499143 RepID=UPI0010214097|nr:HAMP domain-containing sensor histidine kinase [Streptomyces sp. RFCAC02]
MRRSLRLRLLGVSLAVACLSVVATALLATYGTGARLREEIESSASLLETDSIIHDALLDYAEEHRDWDGVEALVADLGLRTGRRIELTASDGTTIADSAELLGQSGSGRPSTPSARIDAADPPDLLTGAGDTGGTRVPAGAGSGQVMIAYNGWRLTDTERQDRQALADRAVSCLADLGLDAVVVDTATAGVWPHGARSQRFSAPGDVESSESAADACLPDGLYEPGVVAEEVNARAMELATACLDERGLAYEVGTSDSGLRLVRPADGADRSAAFMVCEDAALTEATRPYVAPPAELYLGTSDRFAPFSAEGWWRTAVTAAGVLLAATLVTVLAVRRVVRPILALTGAAQRMGAGDRSARVPVRGNDEVTRLADAFNAMAASIETGDRQRKALVSDIAHELRTPLTNVRSLLEAVEDGVLPLDGELIASLMEESVLLERLVGDLQDLALADAGMLRVHPEERDAADLAGQAAAAHRARAEASGVRIRVTAPDEPVTVYADPARLRQALGNLVANAVTHTADGGLVEVALRPDGDEVVLTVTDTGCGIAPEHLPHVFDRFYRADPSRSRATGGSGLGLAITRHLVEAHGGRVAASSTPGRGSEFTIRLPGAAPPVTAVP